jgi:hypothetical protein
MKRVSVCKKDCELLERALLHRNKRAAGCNHVGWPLNNKPGKTAKNTFGNGKR